MLTTMVITELDGEQIEPTLVRVSECTGKSVRVFLLNAKNSNVERWSDVQGRVNGVVFRFHLKGEIPACWSATVQEGKSYEATLNVVSVGMSSATGLEVEGEAFDPKPL